MKTIRRILFAFLICLTVIIGIGFFLPGHVQVSRSQIISAPKEIVFEQLNSFKNWKNWSPWQRNDPDSQWKYSGPESGNGSVCQFSSKKPKQGNGKITIISSYPSDSLVLEMDFMDKGETNLKFILKENKNGTLVTWLMMCDLGNNPVQRWFGLFVDQMAGNDFEQGLINLKNYISIVLLKSNSFMAIKPIPVKYAITIRDTCSASTINQKLASYFKELSIFSVKRKLKILGSPFAIFHSYSRNSFDIEVGLSVDTIVKSTDPVISKAMQYQRAVMISYSGSYQLSGKAYTSIDNYMRLRHLNPAGPPWEFYQSDSSSVRDSSRWRTEIYYPVQ